jgi:hypothetical protein
MKNIALVLFLFLPISLVNANTIFNRANGFFSNGKIEEAAELYSSILESSTCSDDILLSTLHKLTLALRQSGKIYKLDGIIKKSLLINSKNLKYIIAVANIYANIEHWGVLKNKQFFRTLRGGRNVSSYMRDRVFVLQLYEKAYKIIDSGKYHLNQDFIATFYRKFIDSLLYQRGAVEVERILQLTNTDTLPDYEFSNSFYYFNNEKVFPSLDVKTSNIFFKLKKNYDQCLCDGERWRFIIDKYIQNCPKYKNAALMQFALFYYQLLGLQTVLGMRGEFDTELIQALEGILGSVDTLKDNESIALSSNGITRVLIPENFSYIKIFQNIVDNADKDIAKKAVKILNGIFFNRKKINRALGVLDRYKLRFNNDKDISKLFESILGNSGRFIKTPAQAVGSKMFLRYSFRNAKSIHLKAYKINIKKFLSDMKTYLKSSPEKILNKKLILGSVVSRLNNKEFIENYLGEKILDWNETLKPEKNHRLSFSKIYPSIKKAGLYIFYAELPANSKGIKGSVSKTLVWYNDTVLIMKSFRDSYILYVADALTGAPIKNCNINIYSFKKVSKRGGFWNAFQLKNIIETKNKIVKSSDNGIAIIKKLDFYKNSQFFISINDNKHFAYFGFDELKDFFNNNNEVFKIKKLDNRDKQLAFIVTSSPLYYPGNTVYYNCIVNLNKSNDLKTESQRKYTLLITAPNGTVCFNKSFMFDSFGTYSGSFKLDSNAVTGKYSFNIAGLNTSGEFYVENNRKHNFSIKNISNNYKNMNKIEIKMQVSSDSKIIPNIPLVYRIYLSVPQYDNILFNKWSWLYGNIYNSKSFFLNNKERLDCFQKSKLYLNAELIIKNTVYTNDKGNALITINTTLDKILFKGKTLQYDIIAEAELPNFGKEYEHTRLFLNTENKTIGNQTDKNFYSIGDILNFDIDNRNIEFISDTQLFGDLKDSSLDTTFINLKNKAPVQSVKLLKFLKKDNDKYSEILLQNWNSYRKFIDFPIIETGLFLLQTDCIVDEKSFKSESRFPVVGAGNSGIEPESLNALIILPNKRTYQPGDYAEILITSNAPGESQALVFIRPESKNNAEYKLITLKNGIGTFHVKILKSDTTSFFIQALSIRNSTIFYDEKKIYVPPEKKLLNVELLPTQNPYAGQSFEMQVSVKASDATTCNNATVILIADDFISQKKSQSQNFDIRKLFISEDKINIDNYFLSNIKNNEFVNIPDKFRVTLHNFGVFKEQPLNDDFNFYNFYHHGQPLLSMLPKKHSNKKRSVVLDKSFPRFPSLVYNSKNFLNFSVSQRVKNADQDGNYHFKFKLPNLPIPLKIRCYAINYKNNTSAFGYSEILLKVNDKN